MWSTNQCPQSKWGFFSLSSWDPWTVLLLRRYAHPGVPQSGSKSCQILLEAAWNPQEVGWFLRWTFAPPPVDFMNDFKWKNSVRIIPLKWRWSYFMILFIRKCDNDVIADLFRLKMTKDDSFILVSTTWRTLSQVHSRLGRWVRKYL